MLKFITEFADSLSKAFAAQNLANNGRYEELRKLYNI